MDDGRDKNIYLDYGIEETGMVWYNVRFSPCVVSGLMYDENLGCYTRMPQKIAGQVSNGVAHYNLDTSGGRVRFRTNSSVIAIRAELHHIESTNMMANCGKCGFDMYRRKDGDGRMEFIHPFFPPADVKTEYTGYPYRNNGEWADYVINFPLYAGVKELYIALKKDAVLREPTPYSHPVPVVIYGSSVTQGGFASRPGNCYPSILSRDLDTEVQSLGFSGNGLAEELMVDYFAGLEMSLLICDYDHNAPYLDHLEKTHLPLYRRFREKQPDTPILFMSAQDIAREPEMFVPRREVVRRTYETALQEGDRNVYFIDGEEFFSGDELGTFTVDRCHPNDHGFYRMAKRIEKEIRHLF